MVEIVYPIVRAVKDALAEYTVVVSGKYMFLTSKLFSMFICSVLDRNFPPIALISGGTPSTPTHPTLDIPEIAITPNKNGRLYRSLNGRESDAGKQRHFSTTIKKHTLTDKNFHYFKCPNVSINCKNQ